MLPRAYRVGLSAAVVTTALLASPSAAQNRLSVVNVRPVRHAVTAAAETSISIEFDRPVAADSATPAHFWAFGRWSGAAVGAIRLSNGGRTLTLVPAQRFSAGEMVTVYLSRDLEAVDGTRLGRGGYSFQFWIRSRGTGLEFDEIGRFSTRTRPRRSTRAYGGVAADLDGDRFLDLTIVNEETGDLRTFMNRGDRSGRFRPMLQPPAKVDAVPSPSEPADFDRDGRTDLAVANIAGGTVSILLGRGDGTFDRATHYAIGGEPRGLATLDADGDGDVDVAATSFVDGSVTVLLNDGAGAFRRGEVFGTGDGERALAAGDMDDDGVLDLVVGLRGPDEIHVYRGRGDGTFAFTGGGPAGGAVWMLALGDVDGNGTEDVAAVNSASDNAAILLGDGRGGLGAPRTVATDPFPLATDLADLDGDGDLDWVTSSFFGGWMLFANDGDGGFTHHSTVAARQAASCSLPFDLDNDSVLDLALIDELEDEVVLLGSRAELFASGFESGDTSAWSRRRGPVAVIGPGLGGSGHALEVPVGRGRAFVASLEPDRETSVVVEVELDPRRVDLDGAVVDILHLGARRPHAIVTLERDGRRYRVRLMAREADGLREVGSARIRPSGRARLAVEWVAATGPGVADGRAALILGQRTRGVADDLANHGRFVQRVALGLPAGSRGAAGGAFLVDGYRSRR